MTRQQLFASILIAILCLALYTLIEVLIIKYNGADVPAPAIPREPQILGVGTPLTYVVMGDSTSIGQGTDYKNSYAATSAQYLAKTHEVTFINTGISGAKVSDVIKTQLDQATINRPDIVLLGVGANDTTHFTRLSDLQTSLQHIIDELRRSNPDIHIILTRSPAMDAVSRFPWLSKQLLRFQTARVNKTFDEIIAKNNLTPALIAEKTRDAFLADPSLTAADNFHPNARGYALWTPVITDAIDTALKTK
jgi:lysophospholipase L1-like esterase